METKHKAMIDSIELRIGNLAYPMDRSGEVHTPIEIPFKIMEITQIDVRGHIARQQLHQVVKYDEFSIRDISPIPLTEEWLLKAGFEQDGAYYIKDLFGSTFIEFDCDGELYNLFIRQLGEFGESDCIFMSITIEHVHQLQNLYFALTGKELEFKI